jgi:predicted nucleic-acid-binding Zn-ribbon protein
MRVPSEKRPQPEPVEIFDRSLKCQFCGYDYFWRRNILLNTRTATFFDLDWLNQSATCFICDRCGYIHWFLLKD